MNLQKLIDILLELRTASLQLGKDPSESDIKSLMHRYDMLFLGKNINLIYSIELCHSLKTYFHIDTDIDELNSLIPVACKNLNMKYETLVAIDELDKNPKIKCYEIILW